MDRSSLLADKPSQVMDDKTSLPFVPTFSVQHRSIKKLIQKHWHLLGGDQVLKNILPAKPRTVFKGASSIGNRIAPSVQGPPKVFRCFFQHFTGYYPCRKCQVCSLNRCKDRKICSFVSTSTSRAFEVEPFITCSSEGVVYLIQWPCGIE